MKKIFSVLIACMSCMFGMAQEAQPKATGMAADGKIYVVMAVVLTILIGLFIYLIRVDRKISQLEK